MFDLSRFSLSDMVECGRALRRIGGEGWSLGGAAGRVVRTLYDQLGDGRDGGRACALVRLYRAQPFESLGADLQRRARALAPEGRPPRTCLTLLATAGDRPEWNDCRQSRGHQVLPLSEEGECPHAPVLGQLVRRLGPEEGAADREGPTYDVVHVPEARGSPLVVAQDEFVVPCGIASVLGFGADLPGGERFAVLLFSRVAIPPASAGRFRPLALSARLALLSGGECPAGAGADRSATLGQLLEEHERALLEQSAAPAGDGATGPGGAGLPSAEEALRRARDELEEQVRQRTAELVRANDALRESEALLRLFVEHTPAAVAMFDRNLRYLLVSRRWAADYGLGEQDLIGRRHYEVLPDIPARWKEDHRRALAGEVVRYDEDPFPRRDGRTDWVRREIRPWRDGRGEIGGIIMFTEVITERKRAELRLRRADRARRALSGCNQALVHARDEAQFLQDLCRVIVDEAGYRMCWVGYPEQDEARTIRPVAYAGHEDGYLRAINVTWADTERGRGPAGTAVRTRQAMVIRDTAQDPRFLPWRAEALKRGYASVIGIPLLIGADVLGALTIYASEPDTFDEEEVRLLEELADDLSYGVAALRTRADRERAEEALRRAYDELERRVEERTAALSRANARLVREAADRERAEEAVRTSERLYRHLTEETRDAIVVADERGLITLFNPAAQRTFGYEEREVLGGPLTRLMPPEYHDLHARAVRRYVETRQSRLVGRTVELTGQRKSGEVFPLEVALSAIELPEGLVFLGAIRDLTERQRLQARVFQAEKLASLGLLSAGVAHEINNPLSYVANNLAVLARDCRGMARALALHEEALPALAEARPDLAARIERLADELDLPYVRANLDRLLTSTRQGVQRVSDIVQNLRGFARLDQAAIDQLDVHQALATSLEMIRGRLERRRIAVETNYGELPRVLCAPAQVHQVLLNLLVNAMQAIEATGREGGRITITTRADRDRGEVAVEIADDGCGIPADHLPRIFDPFFTTKPVGQGTGLGLAISHGIVTDHGGRIEVESTPGLGSRFRVVLPVGGPGKGDQPAAPALQGPIPYPQVGTP